MSLKQLKIHQGEIIITRHCGTAPHERGVDETHGGAEVPCVSQKFDRSLTIFYLDFRIYEYSAHVLFTLGTMACMQPCLKLASTCISKFKFLRRAHGLLVCP